MKNKEKFKEIFLETFGDPADDFVFDECGSFYCKGRNCSTCERSHFWTQEYIEKEETNGKK